MPVVDQAGRMWARKSAARMTAGPQVSIRSPALARTGGAGHAGRARRNLLEFPSLIAIQEPDSPRDRTSGDAPPQRDAKAIRESMRQVP
jgi:hypothetical protein